MGQRTIGLLFCASLVTSVGMTTAALADASFYAGKTVRMVVGFGPGGGYDTFSRMIAPYLGKVLGATVIVENQPGAGGMTSLNRLFVSQADGLTLSLVEGTGAAFAQLTERQGVRYDLTRFGYLATVGAPPAIWVVAPDSPIKTVSQAIAVRQKWRWAASGVSSSLAIGAAFTCEALRLDCQIVPGYTGTNQASLAVAQKEMDAIFLPESSANNFVQAKQNAPLATMARVRSRFFSDLPTIFEAIELDPEQTWLFDFFDQISSLGRIMVVPPDMPADRLAFLQEAVRKTLNNPQLIAEGEKAGRIIEYMDPDTTYKNVQSVIADVTPEQKARIRDIVAGIGATAPRR